jgi:intraflagellar transport protein 46
VANQPYDEAVALSDEDSMDSAASPQRLPGAEPDVAQQQQQQQQQHAPAPAPAAESPPGQHSFEDSDDPDDSLDQAAMGADASAVYPSAAAAAAATAEEREFGHGEAGGETHAAHGSDTGGRAAASDDDESSSSDEEGGMGGGGMAAGYDPSEYDNMDVGADVKDLFQHIERYKPHQIELDTRLKPFIPDFIPAVGDIDAFVKVPRPDNAAQDASMQLGLGILDEPSVVQSDPSVLELQLRQSTKQANLRDATVRSVESADKQPQVLTQWITSINDLHRSKPQAKVGYTHTMPTLDNLMQAWPSEVEDMLSKVMLPTAMIDLDLPQFVTTLCAVLDIPVHEGKLTESLHLLFELFSEFKKNQHFAVYADAGGEGMAVTGDFGNQEIAGTDTTFTA